MTHTFIKCPKCGSEYMNQKQGKGPHHAALHCAECDRFIKWLKAPIEED